MDQQIRVLVIDDDEPHAQAVAESLERVGYDCVVATSGREGIRLIEEQTFDIVLTDLLMEGVDGMDVLAKAKRELPDAEVVILTAHNTIKAAVTAMQAGATTYLTKPLDINELRTVADKVSQSQRLARSNIELQRQLNERFGFEGVIGNSPGMHAVVAKLRQVAPTSATVLISGESGTGKELVAKALHNNSPRRYKPFIPLNCAALSENILESELFGHVRGAFTGADRERKGWFEHANGGTLFLDEVGDIPLSTQVKLLRALESGEIVRVGTNEPIKVNVRLISATNRDLNEAIATGAFRQDLYHRLKVISIKLPPLRQRREDIPLLLDYFLKDLSAAHGREIKLITPAARKALMSYAWPGNVRELKNTVESMVVIDADGVLDVDDLTEDVAVVGLADAPARSAPRNLVGPPARGDREVLYRRDPQANRRQPRGGRSPARHRRAHALPEDQEGKRHRLSDRICQSKLDRTARGMPDAEHPDGVTGDHEKDAVDPFATAVAEESDFPAQCFRILLRHRMATGVFGQPVQGAFQSCRPPGQRLDPFHMAISGGPEAQHRGLPSPRRCFADRGRDQQARAPGHRTTLFGDEAAVRNLRGEHFLETWPAPGPGGRVAVVPAWGVISPIASAWSSVLPEV